MVPPHEMVLQLDHVELVARVGPVHQLKQPDLNLSLVQKRFLVLDDFDGHVAGFLVIVGLDNLRDDGRMINLFFYFFYSLPCLKKQSIINLCLILCCFISSRSTYKLGITAC